MIMRRRRKRRTRTRTRTRRFRRRFCFSLRKICRISDTRCPGTDEIFSFSRVERDEIFSRSRPDGPETLQGSSMTVARPLAPLLTSRLQMSANFCNSRSRLPMCHCKRRSAASSASFSGEVPSQSSSFGSAPNSSNTATMSGALSVCGGKMQRPLPPAWNCTP
jgi:hypothetical protein